MYWRDCFSSVILKRGEEYYKHGKVEIGYIEKDSAIMTVCGTEYYDVELTFDEDVIVRVECECPHFKQGNLCKHLVASILTLPNQEGIKIELEKRSNKNLSIEELLNMATTKELRNFLNAKLESNRTMLQEFKQFIHYKEPMYHLEELKDEIDQMLVSMNEYWELWNDGYPFEGDIDTILLCELQDFESEHLIRFYEERKYELILSGLEYLLEKISSARFIVGCQSKEFILHKYSFLLLERTKEKEVFDSLFSILKKVENNYFTLSIVHFLIEKYDGKYVERVLKLIMMNVELLKNNQNNMKYQEEWIMCALLCLDKLHRNHNEMKELVDAYKEC